MFLLYLHIDYSNTLRNSASIGPREEGTIADNKGADYVFETLNSYGLDVQRKQVPYWVIEPIKTEFRMIRPENIKFKSR